MNMHDTYMALINNNALDSGDIGKLYTHTCDLYRNLIVMGPLFSIAARQAKIIRDACAERLRDGLPKE